MNESINEDDMCVILIVHHLIVLLFFLVQGNKNAGSSQLVPAQLW